MRPRCSYSVLFSPPLRFACCPRYMNILPRAMTAWGKRHRTIHADRTRTTIRGVLESWTGYHCNVGCQDGDCDCTGKGGRL